MILLNLELRHHRRNMNGTQAEKKKSEQTPHGLRGFFSLGLRKEDFRTHWRCGFSPALTEEQRCFGFTFLTLYKSQSESQQIRWRLLQPLPAPKLEGEDIFWPNEGKNLVKFLRWLSFQTQHVRACLLLYSKKENIVA